MSDVVPTSTQSPFDGLMGEDGRWSARALAARFGYARWSDVRDGIGRAKAAIANTSGEVAVHDHVEVGLTMIQTGKGAQRQVEDFRLTRYGAYMWAMNGDPRKSEIAAAQTYFATKTREAEVGRELSPLEILKQQVSLMEEQERRTKALEQRQTVVEAKISAIEGEYDEFTALAYAKLHDLFTHRSYLSRLGKEATRLMHLDGREPHKRQDATFGAVNVYPATYLGRAAETVS